MATFWTFLLFGITVVSCVKLENLCASDTFVYKGVQVNSFQRLRLNVTFEPLQFYLIKSDVTCDPNEFKNETNYFEALKLKNRYNRRLAELYTEMSGAKIKELEISKELRKGSWFPLRDIYFEEKNADCLESMERTAYSGVALFMALEDFFDFNRHAVLPEAAFKPTKAKTTRWLDKLMNKFEEDTDGPRFAFESEEAWQVLSVRKTILPKELRFLIEGEGRTGPNRKSMLTYDLFLPFENKSPSNDRCVPVDDLPLFFKNKGRKQLA